MSVQESLAAGFGRVNLIMERHSEGITEEESRREAIAGAACANWLVGHQMMVRSRFASQVGWERALDEKFQPIYGKGSKGQLDEGAGLGFDELRGIMARHNEHVVKFILGLSEGDLLRPVTHPIFGATSLPNFLAEITVHEGYHAGQLAFVRRALGYASFMGRAPIES